MTEFEFGHIGMARRESALECAREIIKIDFATERAKRRRVRMSTFAPRADRMAAPTKFRNQLLAVTDHILRPHGRASSGQRGKQREDRRQTFYHGIFTKKEWRAGRDSNP